MPGFTIHIAIAKQYMKNNKIDQWQNGYPNEETILQAYVYAYSKTGVEEKAEAIYADILETSEKNAIFNMLLIAKFFIAKLKLTKAKNEEAMLLINDALALLQKLDNQSKILFSIFEKLFIDVVSKEANSVIDINSEVQKLLPYTEKLSFLLKKEDLLAIKPAQPQQEKPQQNQAAPQQAEQNTPAEQTDAQ